MIHNGKYEYNKTLYVQSKDKVIITCPIHGDFEQRAGHHMSGHGCKLCADINTGNELRKNVEEFINSANIIHNSYYDYSLVKYKGAKSKVKIICPIHGIFEQIPDSHINAKNGCPICKLSKGESLIFKCLSENNIKFEREYKINLPIFTRKTPIIYVDFAFTYNDQQYFIEYDGEQHFKYIPHFHKGDIMNLIEQQNRDSILKEYCKLHNIILINFDYTQSESDIIKEVGQMFRF